MRNAHVHPAMRAAWGLLASDEASSNEAGRPIQAVLYADRQMIDATLERNRELESELETYKRENAQLRAMLARAWTKESQP